MFYVTRFPHVRTPGMGMGMGRDAAGFEQAGAADASTIQALLAARTSKYTDPYRALMLRPASYLDYA